MRNFLAGMALLMAFLLFIPGCTSVSSNCAQPETFCVGLVTDVGRRDDQAYNQAAWEGIQQAKSDDVADWTASIETIDSRDYEENIRFFAEAGYDVIVTIGYDSSAATYSAAGQYANIRFIGVDQNLSGDQKSQTNLVWLVFPEDQQGFLAGALAAAMTQTGQVGAVCASDTWPPMKSYGGGFIAGVLYINPDVKATVTYHNEVGWDKTFTDPAWGAATANSLINDGADIIFGAGGTTGSNAVVTAASRSAYGIGADVDQYYLLPAASSHILTSVLKMITPAIVDLLKATREAQAQRGTFPAGNYYGEVGLAPYHDLDLLVQEEVKLQIDNLSHALLSGKIRTGVSPTSP